MEKSERAAHKQTAHSHGENPSGIVRRLPMTTAVESTCPTAEAATHRPVRDAAMVSVSAAAVGWIARTPVEPSTVTSRTVPPTSIQAGSIEAGSIIAVVPRTGTDKDTTHEPLRTIVAIGCASVGIIAVIAIRTYRRRTHISRAYRDPKGNPCMSRNRRQNNKDAQ